VYGLPTTRRGEALGWLIGWLGSLAWLVALAWLLTARGAWLMGAAGGALFVLGLTLTWRLAPWRHPETPYWRLLLPLYLPLGVGVTWAIAASGGWASSGLSGWEALWCVPLLSPLFTIGARRWQDGERPRPSEQANEPPP